MIWSWSQRRVGSSVHNPKLEAFWNILFFLSFSFSFWMNLPIHIVNIHFPDEMKRMQETKRWHQMKDENKKDHMKHSEQWMEIRKFEKKWKKFACSPFNIVVRWCWCWCWYSFWAESLFTIRNHQPSAHIIIDSKYQSVSGVSFARYSYLFIIIALCRAWILSIHNIEE